MKKVIKNKNKGFTIVELIVVMAIIAILILIAVPTFTKYIDDANKTSEMGSADTIYKSAMAVTVESYVASTKPKLTDLATNIKAGTSSSDTMEVRTYTAGAAPTYGTEVESNTDAWLIYLAGTTTGTGTAATATLDATGDIYILAPAKDSKRNEYKNGEFTGTSKSTTSSAPEPSESEGEEVSE